MLSGNITSIQLTATKCISSYETAETYYILPLFRRTLYDTHWGLTTQTTYRYSGVISSNSVISR